MDISEDYRMFWWAVS